MSRFDILSSIEVDVGLDVPTLDPKGTQKKTMGPTAVTDPLSERKLNHLDV